MNTPLQGGRAMTRWFVAFILLVLPSFALAAKRVALVVGNSAYEHAGNLTNPRNDAVDLAVVLRRFGFDVLEGFDLNKIAFDAALKRLRPIASRV
ncbi:MAG: caspase family protein [Rhodospirillales bacterium]|nr:caspase family protein [Rhodospirillales bacterium]